MQGVRLCTIILKSHYLITDNLLEDVGISIISFVYVVCVCIYIRAHYTCPKGLLNTFSKSWSCYQQTFRRLYNMQVFKKEVIMATYNVKLNRGKKLTSNSHIVALQCWA